jgi:uncharacterized protein (TIGR02598 family)
MKRSPYSEASLRPRNSRAFSLIEVTIALAIVSVTFIALLGLLPVGLNTFTRSVDASVETQIGQSVLAQARQVKFSELEEFLNQKYDFDDQGKPVGDKDDRIYYANPLAADGNPPDIKISYKGNIKVGEDASAANTTISDANLAIISITIRKVSSPREKSTVVGFIANNGL